MFMLKMGNVFSKNKKDIKIVTVVSKKDLLKYPHLKLRGEIVVRKDLASCIPEIDLRFEIIFLLLYVFDLVNLTTCLVCLLLKVTILYGQKRVEFKL